MVKFLIAFDLDGTVLPKVNEINERTVNAVKEAKARGHIPVIASARHFPMIRWVYEAMGLDSPVCTINGAHIYHPGDPSFTPFECSIPRETTAALLAAAVRENCTKPMYIEYRNSCWYTSGHHNSYYGARVRASEPAIMFDAANLPDTAASRIILTPPDYSAVERIKSVAAGLGGLVSESWDFVPGASDVSGIRMSISPAGANKWHGVRMIADYYGIPTENIYAFGDMWNDFSMLENAGHGFALKGSDAEKASKAKNVTRLSCAECGVADVIEREILG